MNNFVLNMTYAVAIMLFVAARIIEIIRNDRPLPIYCHLITAAVIAVAMALQLANHSWAQTIALAILMSAAILNIYLSYARPRLEEKLAAATHAVADLLMKNNKPSLNKETN